MYIGTQTQCKDDVDIEQLAQLGVVNVDQTPTLPWAEWTADYLKAERDRFEKYGVNLEMIHIPLGSRNVFKNEAGAIFLVIVVSIGCVRRLR
jgi:mannonate dehydratase